MESVIERNCRMKWAIFLGSASVGGGTYVIFEHAVRAYERGEQITIVTMEPVSQEDLYWHPKAAMLRWMTLQDAQAEQYDVVISTWWRLVYEAYRLVGRHYLYFVQSVESKFYVPEEKPIRQLAEATYLLPMQMITEASWIRDYLREHYCKEALLVHNGIRKDIYTPDGECYAPRERGKLRILVEGPVDVDFKNIPKTVGLCMASQADEIWLMTASDISSYKGADRVFSRVPITETPKIYRSCDVIVKLSYVEGMFGPPLEMFHCGGTAITYDVTGHDEYIVHGVNALVAETDDDEKVIEYINRLKREPDFLDKLKQGALKTAKQWISWEQSSKQFYDAVYQLCEKKTEDTQERIEKESKFHFESYVIAEDYHNEIRVLKQTSLWKRWLAKLKARIPLQVKIRIKKKLGLKC